MKFKVGDIIQEKRATANKYEVIGVDSYKGYDLKACGAARIFRSCPANSIDARYELDTSLAQQAQPAQVGPKFKVGDVVENWANELFSIDSIDVANQKYGMTRASNNVSFTETWQAAERNCKPIGQQQKPAQYVPKFRAGDLVSDPRFALEEYEILKVNGDRYDMKHVKSGNLYPNEPAKTIDGYYAVTRPAGSATPAPTQEEPPKKRVPKSGDTVVYLGGHSHFDKDYKIGNRYPVAFFTQNKETFLCVMGIASKDYAILEGKSGREGEAMRYFRLIDKVTEFVVPPSDKCNCLGQYSPKGCEKWCNTQPEKKTA